MQSKNQQLEKARNNFENKANEYAIMYKEEQAEKKIREGKFLNLQENHTTLRIKMERIITGLIVVLAIFLVIFALLYFIGAISLEIPQN